MFHANDADVLRQMLRLKAKDPWPQSLLEIYERARHLANPVGTGNLPDATLIDICLRVQDAEKAAKRPAPALPDEVNSSVPQHQRMPSTKKPQKELAEAT
jgi:hypothetical protein